MKKFFKPDVRNLYDPCFRVDMIDLPCGLVIHYVLLEKVLKMRVIKCDKAL